MMDYKEMYFFLFNEISIAIERLAQAQAKAEQMYMDQGEQFPPEGGNEAG